MCSYATEQGERVEPGATFQLGFSVSAEECLQYWCREVRKDVGGRSQWWAVVRNADITVAVHLALMIRRIRRIRRMLAGNAGVQALSKQVFPVRTLPAADLPRSSCCFTYITGLVPRRSDKNPHPPTAITDTSGAFRIGTPPPATSAAETPSHQLR